MEVKPFNLKTPLDYGKWACDTMMKIPADQLPPIGSFHYHQGVFLMGMQKIYRLCENEEYYRYIKSWVDSVLNDKEREIEVVKLKNEECSRAKALAFEPE